MSDFMVFVLIMATIFTVAGGMWIVTVALITAISNADRRAIEELLQREGGLPTDHLIAELQIGSQIFSVHKIHREEEYYIRSDVRLARLASLGDEYSPCTRRGCYTLQNHVPELKRMLSRHPDCALIIPAWQTPRWNEAPDLEVYALMPFVGKGEVFCGGADVYIDRTPRYYVMGVTQNRLIRTSFAALDGSFLRVPHNFSYYSSLYCCYTTYPLFSPQTALEPPIEFVYCNEYNETLSIILWQKKKYRKQSVTQNLLE